MKILKRNEQITEVARQRREQIDEGVILATKIDTLRRTTADLEKQHREYISGMAAQLSREIEPLKNEKDSLVYQIEKANNELARLRIPLDEEWSKAKKLSDDAVERMQSLNIREQELVQAESSLESEREELEKSKDELETLKKDALDDANVAVDTKAEAARILRITKIKCEEDLEAIVKRIEGIKKKEEELVYKAVDLNSKEDFLNDKEEALIGKERAVTDKYETLLRTLNRINQ